MEERSSKLEGEQHRHAIKAQPKHAAEEKTVCIALHRMVASQPGFCVHQLTPASHNNCNLDYFRSEYSLKVQNNSSKHTALSLRNKKNKKQVSLNAQIKGKGECILDTLSLISLHGVH